MPLILVVWCRWDTASFFCLQKQSSALLDLSTDHQCAQQQQITDFYRCR